MFMVAVIFLSLCAAVCLPSCCFLFLCQRTLIFVLIYYTFLLWTFSSYRGASSTRKYFTRLQTTLHTKLFPSYIVHIKTCPKNANFKKYLQGEASKLKLGMWLRGEKFRAGLSETDISELNFEDWAEVGYVHGTEEKAFLPERAAWAKAQRGERRTSGKCK